jgi:outer membrane protein assembly factor BamB
VNLAVAAVDEPGDYPRRFGTPERNSRMGVALPQGTWRPRFQAPVRGVVGPRDVLVLGDRIVVGSERGFALHDPDGERIGGGALGDGTILLDPLDALLFGVDPDGLLTGWNLATGERRFRMILLLPGPYARVFLDRPGDLYLASVETAVPPHSGRQPSQSLVERYSLGDPIAVDHNGALISAERTGDLIRDRSDLVIARHGQRLVIAVEDSIYQADQTLRLATRLSGRFRPVAMSLDEAGRAYLVVSTETGPALWAVEPDGRRLFETPLPPFGGPPLAPPIVSRHHLVYLVYADRILAFESDGRPSWSFAGAVAGATLTGDDRLLVSVGTEVRSLRTGGPGELVTSIAEPVLTPPVLSADGTLLFASADTLYAFQAVKRAP